MKRFAASGLLALGLATFIGCAGEPRIDTSSDETMKESISAAKESLSPDERKEFEKVLKMLAFSNVDNLFQLAADPDSLTRNMKDQLHGKTAREVMAEAKKVEAERAAKQREQIVSEIAELEEKKEKAELAQEQLKAFAIERSRFYYDDLGFSTEPTIEITVKNGTKHAVASADFHGVLATPGRAVPWVEGDFSYSISGGLEPGESATWKLHPNLFDFGGWSSAPRDRNDMVLTVTTTRIDGPDGKPILEADFSDDDQERLDELKESLAKLERR